MCGRVRLSSDHSEIKIQLKFHLPGPAPNFAANWNMAPTQPGPIVRRDGDTIALELARWGLLPFWTKQAKLAYSTFNARAETILTTPAFREAWKRGRRCLVPVDSFYEWMKLEPENPKSAKQPYAIARSDRRLMTMAGLWDIWKSPEGEAIRSFTIITCAANPFMSRLHNRMPVILPETAQDAWLSESPSGDPEISALLRPYEADDLIAWPVSSRVGNVRNNDPSLIEPLAA